MSLAANPLRPTRRRTKGFMLIPLVDVIFLLLTFFMLASSIDPFSLLTLDDYRSRAQGAAARAPGKPQPAPDLIVSVGRGIVQANGAPVPLDGFAGAAAALRRQGLNRVLVFTRPEATVQDIVSVIDALKKASFPAVVIRGGNG